MVRYAARSLYGDRAAKPDDLTGVVLEGGDDGGECAGPLSEPGPLLVERARDEIERARVTR